MSVFLNIVRRYQNFMITMENEISRGHYLKFTITQLRRNLILSGKYKVLHYHDNVLQK